MTAFAESSLPASPIDPEPSSRIVQETGALQRLLEEIRHDLLPVDEQRNILRFRSVIGTPFPLRAVKGTMT